jgi:sugar diacid utilization regulator
MLLRYAREVAFAAAEVYARAAETRGAWDARLESLVVDAVVRGDGSDALASQASALSWEADRPTTVVVAEPDLAEASPALWRRTARDHDAEIITGRQGARLVALIGGPEDPLPVVRALLPLLGEGPVVVGPTSPGLAAAGRSARAALSGIAAAVAWPEAPRPVLASALLAERVLAGDESAGRALVDLVHRPLAEAGDLLATVSAYLAHGGTLEATARQLFVHPNTVRYRLGRVAELTGLRPADPRDRWTLQVAVALGRLRAGPTPL